MKFRIDAKKLCEVLEASTCSNTLKPDCSIEALQGCVIVRASDGVSYSEIAIPAVVEREGKVVAYTPMLLKLLRAIGQQEIGIEMSNDKRRLVVRLDNGACYLLPSGLEQDDDPLRARLTALMSEAKPVVTFASPRIWKDCSVVKQFRGNWDFNYILLLPILQKPDWTSREVVAAVAATDQAILGAVLLTEDQAELHTEFTEFVDSAEAVVFILPELSSLQIQSFALADYDGKRYLYAIMEHGFVSVPTHSDANASMCRIINRLLVAPADAQLRFDRTTWRNLKKAIETYAERKTPRLSRSIATARWDIRPDGSHRLWSSSESEILFTADKAEVTGLIPRVCTFWVNLLNRAVKFIPVPSVIELTFNENTCTMRLRDEFNYRICVVQSMVTGSDYESFQSGGDGP